MSTYLSSLSVLSGVTMLSASSARNLDLSRTHRAGWGLVALGAVVGLTAVGSRLYVSLTDGSDGSDGSADKEVLTCCRNACATQLSADTTPTPTPVVDTLVNPVV